MNKITRLSSYVMICIALALTSCKKDSTTDDLDSGADVQQLASDESNLHNESESTLTDLNSVMESSQFGKGYTIKGATVNDTTFAGSREIIITFNGDNADGSRTRTGTVTLQLIEGTKWSEAGAVMKITYANFTITRKADSKQIVFNGIFYLRNVSGGKVFVNPEVIHKYWGEGLITFQNSTTRTWMINRKRTFTNSSGVLGVKTEGDTTVNGISNVMVWGIARNSTAFYTQVSSPIVVSSTCTNGPVSGVKVHKGFKRDVMVTFGVDQSGNAVSSGCAYGFKVEWKNLKDVSKSAIIAY